MSSKCIAINYRMPDDKLASDKPGCWKEFTDEGAARIWLNWRKGKTDGSPKGGVVYLSVPELQAALEHEKKLPPSLVKAIQAYLKWLNQ